MSYENIIFEISESVAVIKFNRPKALNAINRDVLRELGNALDKVEADGRVKALVLTGAGEKAFVAGADISQVAKFSTLEAQRFSRDGQDILFRLGGLPIPVIACANGFTLGGGLELAMACDFIYASENAGFGLPEIKLGVIPGFGGTQRLSRLVGKAMAKELCMTGRMISAVEAKEIGLVNKLFSPDRLWEETIKTAGEMSSKGSVSMRAIKQSIDRGLDVDLRSGCYMESDAFALCKASPDAKEGLTAFLEKREPEFNKE